MTDWEIRRTLILTALPWRKRLLCNLGKYELMRLPCFPMYFCVRCYRLFEPAYSPFVGALEEIPVEGHHLSAVEAAIQRHKEIEHESARRARAQRQP